MSKPRFIPWLAKKALTAFDKFIEFLAFEAKDRWNGTEYVEGLMAWMALFCFSGLIFTFFIPSWFEGFILFFTVVPLGLYARSKYREEVS